MALAIAAVVLLACARPALAVRSDTVPATTVTAPSLALASSQSPAPRNARSKIAMVAPKATRGPGLGPGLSKLPLGTGRLAAGGQAALKASAASHVVRNAQSDGFSLQDVAKAFDDSDRVSLQKNEFICDGQVFKYGMELWEQGQQSTVATAASEGSQFIMKRPKYSDTLWDDNLRKECFVLRYLNQAGVQGVPNCVADCVLTAADLDQVFDATSYFKRGKHDQGKTPSWHVIMMETVPGRSFMDGTMHLNSRDSSLEQLAVQNMLQTTWGMLQAGVVNGDQWHNVLFTEAGEANFIDFEGAGFLNEQPLAAVQELVNGPLAHEKQVFDRAYSPPYKVEAQPPDAVLAGDHAERSVRTMVHALFWLIPPNCKDAAADSMLQRPSFGEEIDGIIDEEWQKYLQAVADGYGA